MLGYDLWKRCQEGPAEALNATECTQPAMLTAGVATYRLWRERGGPVPKLMAGHSLGEFSALVAAGCLDFKTAVGLVKFRAEGHAGRRAAGSRAPWPRSWVSRTSDVEAACAEAAQGEVVEAVNFNAPGQVVIAGRAAAVARAIEAATAKGARRALALPDQRAGAQLADAAGGGAAARAARGRRRAERPRGSRSTASTSRFSARRMTFAPALVKQLHTPVYWAATVRTMIAAGATHIVECGPGKVLTSLNRRVDKNRDLKMLALEDPAVPGRCARGSEHLTQAARGSCNARDRDD